MNAYTPRWQAFAARIVMIVAVAAMVVFPTHSAFAQAVNPAESFVQQNIDRGYQILNNHGLTGQQRRAQFRDFLLSLTDLHRIGLFTLGQYANSAPPSDIQAFQKAFEDYASAVYETRLGKYTGQTLKVTGSQARAADDVIVNAVVVDPQGKNPNPIRVGFRVRNSEDGKPIITDMQVEGIWLALSERSDFTGFLQQHGGSVASLADHLRAQADQVRAESSKNGNFG